MKSQKHFFNMVEVALALLVISLGLSTVLTLFPAGLKATREAENANNSVEAAEYIFAYLQEQGVDNISERSTRYTTSPPTAQADINAGKRVTSPDSGVYVFHKYSKLSSGNVEDFSCVAQIVTAEAKVGPSQTSGTLVYLPAVSGNGFTESGNRTRAYSYHFNSETSGTVEWKRPDDNKNFVLCKIVDVEFSYPASLAYDQRTKRMYRMCILNTDCDFYKKGTTP